MSAAPSVPPFFDDAADVLILSASTQRIHLIPHTEASSESSPWVESAGRRCFDFALAAIGLALASPMMALTALLVRATSTGPALFRQDRAGRGRAPFTLYKFRSMRVEPQPGSPLTVDGDPRVTPLGAFLRRYKLDELPQLWNVLRGDLSLVGPRPKLPHLEALELPYRPGLTGMATLAFRNEELILSELQECHVDAFYASCIKPRKAQLDRQYMRRATLWSDLALLWRTASSCILRSDSVCTNQTEILRSMAVAWPGTPPQASENGDSELHDFASYFARIELHGAQWPADYQKLDKALQRHGFSNVIQGHESGHPLPMALYFSVDRMDDLHAVARTVKYCADRTGYRNEVLVIKSAGSRFYSNGVREISEDAA